VLTLHWLHRKDPAGLILYLHGFGDDALGTLGYARQMPEWDAAAFTFRGRDQDPSRLCTLGAKESGEVTGVVEWLERQGVPRRRIVLAGVSQGAGVALLALADLERSGSPLAGALLESPFENLREAARQHLRGVLGAFEPLARPAEALALAQAGRVAGFDPDEVSPRHAVLGVKTPLAFLTGDADAVTPLAGVQSMASIRGAPLLVVVGAGHCEAGVRVPGGWGAWAHLHLRRWGAREHDGQNSFRPL
jgi:pimeloyl-ACP methyl ester carboxylesterase